MICSSDRFWLEINDFLHSCAVDRFLYFTADIPSRPDVHEVFRIRGLCRQDRKVLLVDGWFFRDPLTLRFVPIDRSEFEVFL